MARDEPVRDADGPAEPTVSDDEQSEHSILDRRSYLKLASATAVAAGVGTSAASAAEGDYEVIEARGQSIRIDSGETWENKLIDFGDRNNITITAKGSNWTIRNIGFTGTIPYNETIFGVCDSGSGTSVMENIYFGESTGEQPSSERSICIWVDPSHSGHLDVTNVNFNVPGNNGIYGSAPAYNGDGGTIELEGCYGNDCHHTAFRIGDCGMSIENCVSYKSGTTRGEPQHLGLGRQLRRRRDRPQLPLHHERYGRLSRDERESEPDARKRPHRRRPRRRLEPATLRPRRLSGKRCGSGERQERRKKQRGHLEPARGRRGQRG